MSFYLWEEAPDFNLLATDGRHYSLSDFTNDCLVVFSPATIALCKKLHGITRKTVEKFQNAALTLLPSTPTVLTPMKRTPMKIW